MISIAAKIKVSYTTHEELQEIVKRLQPMLRNVKVSKNNQGKYKKAYIDLKGDNEDVK